MKVGLRPHCLLISTAVLGLHLVAASTRGITIDFEGLTAMGYVNGTAVPASAQLSNELLATYGVQFSSGSGEPYVAVVTLGTGHATSGSKGIGPVSSSGVLDYAAGIRVEFFLPSSPTTKAMTGSVSIKGDKWTAGGLVHMDAYDAAGVLVGSDVHTNGPPVQMSVVAPGIHSVVFTPDQPNVAFDDLGFAELMAVPEPSILAMLGVGVGVILTAAGRRWKR